MASTLLSPSAVVSKAFCPGHITGFFEPQTAKPNNPLLMGSRGAGFSIDKGIETTVFARRSTISGSSISINGQMTNNAQVSKCVLKKYLTISKHAHFIDIRHNVDIPIGFGLGSSGAGALSLSIALNEALGIGLSPTEVAQIAHLAEIECRTGLGTVIAEMEGGFEVRTQPGAPGIGTIVKFPLDGYKAVILCISPISTPQFLTNNLESINGKAGKMVDAIVRSKDPQEFLKMSFEFADHFGLTKHWCKAPLRLLSSMGYQAGVAIFGETVFTLVPAKEAQRVSEALRGFSGTMMVCNIDSLGARSI